MEEGKEKVGQEQIHTLLFQDKLSWQAIIYDLINTEQLDPWDINITLLAEKYLDRVRLLEEADFFVSSKVLLAASLLLRIKSEVVLNEYLPALDELLLGKKEEKQYFQERIELDEDIPSLVPRTPLPRFRRVSLEELMSALGNAIKTENRRIKREILFKQQEREIGLAIPKRSFNLQNKIRELYAHLEGVFENTNERFAFSELTKEHSREDRIIKFVSLLHLDNQQKVWLEQEGHFEEIWIWLKTLYEKTYADELKARRLEVEAFMKDAEKEQEHSDAIASPDIGEPINDEESPTSKIESKIDYDNEEDLD